MELMLMREDLWSTVSNPKPDPADITSAWIRKDEKARAMIGLALEDSQLSHILDAISANDMWQKLTGYHERGSLTNKIHVLRRLCSMRLEEAGNMSHHLVEASELVHRLARMSETLKEHLVVAILLSSLPESYNPLVTALEGRAEGDLKLEYVKGKLLDEWRRRCEDRKQERVQEKVMKATVLPQKKKSIRTCYNCGQEGHIQWICPEKKQKNQEKSQAVQFSDSGSRSGEFCFTMPTRTDRGITEKWIIDTGSSKHMTSSTVNLRSWNHCAEKVMLADGRRLTVRGNGEGRIVGRGLDGDSVEIKIKDLLFVPGLSVNVLSVSQMTNEGYCVQFSSEDCRIMDAGTVVAVGTKKDGVYYLKQ